MNLSLQALHTDILGHENVVVSMKKKAEELSSKLSDEEAAAETNKISDRYSTLCSTVKVWIFVHVVSHSFIAYV